MYAYINIVYIHVCIYIKLWVHKYIWFKISMINVTYYHAILKLNNKHLY